MLKAVLIALALLLPFLVYFDTVLSFISIWNSSETFVHQYIILPTSLWLIWKKRQELAQMTPTPYWPALIVLMICGFAWLVASLAEVQVVRQYAFMTMIVLIVVALLGSRIAKAIAFPLGFLLLAVPFGEVLVTPLIEFTADFTVGALQWTGIPVLREGNSFLIPSGRWSVVEACSGIRYLIASVTLGCLYAYLTYRSRTRQAIFLLISIIVPIIANGLRAYMIVMIGHLSDMRLAVGVDHIIYGWLFFGLVMFLMFWIGGFWHEEKQEQSTVDVGRTVVREQPVSAGVFAAYFVATVACAGIWPVFERYMEQSEFNARHADLSEIASTWQTAPSFTDWSPHFYAPDAELEGFYRHDARTVGANIYFYRNQRPGSMLISSSNRILPTKDTAWNTLSYTTRHEVVTGRDLAVREDIIQSPSGSLLIWYWYWIDGQLTESDYVGKFLQAKERLMMRGDDGARIVVFTSFSDRPDEARQTLRAYLSDNLSQLEAMLAKNRNR